MVENNDLDKAGQQGTDDSQQCCPSAAGESTCCSSAAGGYSKAKFVVFAIIVVAAGVLLARSLMKESNAVNDEAPQLFAAIEPVLQSESPCCPPSTADSAATACETNKDKAVDSTALSLWRPELDSLASLNKVATETDAVFVLIAAADQPVDQTVTGRIEAAAAKIKADGKRICAFRLKKDAPDYAQLPKQFSLPCVLAMVKGGGISTVSGDISEAKLIEAFVKASRPAGCGPAGCGPSGCD